VCSTVQALNYNSCNSTVLEDCHCTLHLLVLSRAGKRSPSAALSHRVCRVRLPRQHMDDSAPSLSAVARMLEAGVHRAQGRRGGAGSEDASQ